MADSSVEQSTAAPFPSWLGDFSQGFGLYARGMGFGQYGQMRLMGAQYAAEQSRQNAQAVAGAGEAAAFTQMQRTQYIAGHAQAVAAGTGGGGSDPTVVNQIARLNAEGAYRSAVDIYGAQSKARELGMQASAELYSGQEAQRQGQLGQSAANVAALNTVLKGGVSLFDRFGKGGPGGNTGSGWGDIGETQ
jgi:hypothetical protein